MSNLREILSDTRKIISSNLFHFTTLYLISVFPTSLFEVIDALVNEPPPPSQTPSLDKSSQLLYGLALLIFNISFATSAPNSIFCNFLRKPIKLSPSLKSLHSSFLPLLPTTLAYSITAAAALSALGIFAGLVLYVIILLGLVEIEAAACFMALVFTTLVLFAALFAYLCVEWCLTEEMESEFGVEGSFGGMVVGMRTVAYLVIMMLATLQGILSALFAVMGGSGRTSDVVAHQLVNYGVLYTLLSLFCFVHCKAFNWELEESDYFPSDEKKLRKIQLPHDEVVDKV